MTQDEAIVIKKITNIENNIKKISNDINSIEKCLKIGKKLGLTEEDLLPWEYKENDLMLRKYNLEGEIENIRNECKHNFTMVGTVQTLFGEENIYQCTKCGFRTTGE